MANLSITHKTCTKCKETKPVSNFSIHRKGRLGLRPRCRACVSSTHQEWMSTQTKEQRWAYHLRLRYGITPEDYLALYTKQDGKCPICLKSCPPYSFKNRRKCLFVDHDHATGKVRGLMCPSCNLAIGVLGDTVDALQRAVSYLSS